MKNAMRAVLKGLLSVSVVCLVSSLAESAGAPSQLLNKTVRLVWQTSGTSRDPDGKSIGFNNTNTRTIYISSAGRPFVRAEVAGFRRSRSGDRDPQTTSSGGVHFEGNRLVGVETFQSGARQFSATFDSNFSSCTLTIIDAKSGGDKIRRRGPDGRMYEIDSSTTSSPSCSIQSGNAFAGQQ